MPDSLSGAFRDFIARSVARMATVNYTELVPVPKGVNAGLKSAGNLFMLANFGNPRSSYSANCQPVTHRVLKGMMVTRSVGPFRVTGYRPAVESLALVMADIKAEQPEIYALLGSAGMLCVRFVRGSTSAISNHSWGTAIDLTVAGVLDAPGNGRVQRALALIAPIFNRHGWFWGGTFGREDAMHFECGEALLRSFLKADADAPSKVVAAPANLDIGDRGPAVVELQKLLNRAGEKLATDGVFGPGTRAALIAWQARSGLRPDGVAGKAALAKLREGKK